MINSLENLYISLLKDSKTDKFWLSPHTSVFKNSSNPIHKNLYLYADLSYILSENVWDNLREKFDCKSIKPNDLKRYVLSEILKNRNNKLNKI